MQKRHIKYFLIIYFKLTLVMCFFSNVLLFYYHYYFVSRHWANFGFLGNLACHSVSELWKENIKIHFQAFFLLHFMYLSL